MYLGFLGTHPHLLAFSGCFYTFLLIISAGFKTLSLLITDTYQSSHGCCRRFNHRRDLLHDLSKWRTQGYTQANSLICKNLTYEIIFPAICCWLKLYLTSSPIELLTMFLQKSYFILRGPKGFHNKGMSKFLLKITKLQVLRHGCDMRKIKWEFFLLKRMMTTAMIHLSTEEKRRLTTKSWSIAKCPIQPGNVECGYYVMSFMKHFMEDPTKPTKTKMMELANKKAYTTAELTEIRTDLINHIMSLVT